MVEFILILGFVVIYFVPSLVAAWGRHPRLAYIGGVNAALGVTGIGWAGALMWALRRPRIVARSYHGDMEVPRSFNLGLLAVIGLVVGAAVIAEIGVNRLQIRHTTQAAAALYAGDATVVQPQWQFATADGAPVASLRSSNSLTPPAPFKGGPVTLSVTRAAEGAVVKLDVDAELACSYAPTASSLAVSFDSGPDQTFACAPAPAGARTLLFDGDHSTAYLADPVAFLARLRQAHTVRIAGDFAGQTAQVMMFALPAEDPVVRVSPAVVRVDQTEPISPAAPAAVPVRAPVEAATAIPVRHYHHHRAVGVSAYVPVHHRHPRGYYLHPYRPVSFRIRHRR